MKRLIKIIKVIFLSIFILLGLLIATFQYSRSWKHGFILQPLYTLPTNEKVVALTFDDGPSELRTPLLLDLLKKHEVKATFFMLGENIEKYKNIAQRVYDEGHLIGNHSFDHPRLILKSPDFMSKQIVSTDNLIQDLGQTQVQYFRPPYSSKYVVLPWVLKNMKKTLVTGTYDPPSEYIEPYDAQKVAQEVIENAQAGSIIFLHDGKNKDQEAFVTSVDLMISALKSEGYTFVTVDYGFK